MKSAEGESSYPEFVKSSAYRVLIDYAYKPGHRSAGVGFFIDKDKFLTCCHVVMNGELSSLRNNQEFNAINEPDEHKKMEAWFAGRKPIIEIELHNGEKVPAQLEKFDEKYDIALLKVENTDGKATITPLDLDANIAYGDLIAFGGFPNQFSYKFYEAPFAYHEGMISSFPSTVIGGERYEHLQINSINLAGNSGAPLFLKGKKEAVGIINGNMNWGRDDLLNKDNKIVPNRVPLSITYATTMKTLREKTKIFGRFA